MQTYPIFLGGEFTETNQHLDITNPYTGKTFAHTFNANEDILEKAISLGLECQVKMAALTSYEKYGILMNLSTELKKHKSVHAEILALESGKPSRYALAEIERSINLLIIAAEESKRIQKEYLSLDWTQPGKGKEGLVKYFPVGLIAGISPFNFPLNLAMHKIAPAIACGCPVIIKPASSTPLTLLEFAKILEKSDLPKGAVSILPMTREMGNNLVTDERFKLLSFTGSASVGWKMKEQAGKKRVVLELGGNAAVIVTDSCDLNLIIDKCLISAFAYSGQICIHAQRFYIHESRFEEFCTLMINKTKTLHYGDPLKDETEISSMIDEDNAKRIEDWVSEAVTQGAHLLTGGKRKGSYYEPTILTNTSTSMKVNCEEVFGPVILIEKYKTFKQAVDLVNDSKFGLQASVFTDSLHETDYAFEHIHSGSVIINDAPSFRVDNMPYGGIKDSGFGREGVRYAMNDMLEPKLLVKNFQ